MVTSPQEPYTTTTPTSPYEYWRTRIGAEIADRIELDKCKCVDMDMGGAYQCPRCQYASLARGK